jgi:hypothetical protein
VAAQYAEELSFGEGKVTYLQLLLQSVDPETFSKEVLPLFQDCASDLAHAKVCFAPPRPDTWGALIWAAQLASPVGILCGASDAVEQGQTRSRYPLLHQR